MGQSHLKLCLSCTKERRRLKQQSNYTAAKNKNPLLHKQKAREVALRWNYGITAETYDAMLASQGGLCAICKSDYPGRYTWHVDHCHKTNVVRGLLCESCNHALGKAKDSIEILKAMISYLERYK